MYCVETILTTQFGFSLSNSILVTIQSSIKFCMDYIVILWHKYKSQTLYIIVMIDIWILRIDKTVQSIHAFNEAKSFFAYFDENWNEQNELNEQANKFFMNISFKNSFIRRVLYIYLGNYI